jgi:hypothetical protein
MTKIRSFMQHLRRERSLLAIFAFVFFLTCGVVAEDFKQQDSVDHTIPRRTPSANAPSKNAFHLNFGDIYVTGMAVILPGGGTIETPSAEKVLAKNLRREMLIPSGSMIVTGASETACVRLGDHSRVRISPDSAVRVYSLHLKLERGEVCIQQGKTVLPLRILASTTAMVVNQESAADFFLSRNGNLIVTVQAGSAALQGKKQRFLAGQRIEVTNGIPLLGPPSTHLLDWSNSPRFTSWPEQVANKMSDGTFDSPAPVADQTSQTDSESPSTTPFPATDLQPIPTEQIHEEVPEENEMEGGS